MSFWYPQGILQLKILFEDFQLSSDASKQQTRNIFVQAKELTVNVGDFRTADTFTAEVDFKNFPFDPRTIRACGVTAYIQDMQSIYNQNGSLNKLTPGASTLVDPKLTNAVFAGFVDEDSISLDESKQTVNFEGRDFTGLLIDQKYAGDGAIDLASPLDLAIKLFIAEVPALHEIKLVDRSGAEIKSGSLPVPSAFMSGANDKLGNSMNGGAHESYWDVIQKATARVGLICYMHLDKLVITTPRNLYQSAHDLKIVYGQNIKSLTFKRKLGRLKNFNLRVTSRNDKEVITADIPVEATDDWCKAYGIKKEEVKVPVVQNDGTRVTANTATSTQAAPYISFPVKGINNKDMLIQIGQNAYQEYSIQQLEGSFETHDMLGHSGVDSSDANFKAFDLTQLDIGQPLAIEIASDDLASISRLKDYEERWSYLRQRNYDITIASLFAETMGRTSPRFFTQRYSMSLGEETGFKLHVDFVNILDISQRNLGKLLK